MLPWRIGSCPCLYYSVLFPYDSRVLSWNVLRWQVSLCSLFSGWPARDLRSGLCSQLQEEAGRNSSAGTPVPCRAEWAGKWAPTRSEPSDSVFSSLISPCLFRKTFFQSSCEDYSVLAKHSGSTDEHQKQFQEEIKIRSCRSGERKDPSGVGGQTGSRRPMFSSLLLQIFSVTLLGLLASFSRPPPSAAWRGALPCLAEMWGWARQRLWEP